MSRAHSSRDGTAGCCPFDTQCPAMPLRPNSASICLFDQPAASRAARRYAVTVYTSGGIPFSGA